MITENSILIPSTFTIKEKEDYSMSLDENKAIVRKAIEALNKQDLSALDDFFPLITLSIHIKYKVWKRSNNTTLDFIGASLIGMKRLRTLLLKRIMCGLVLPLREHIQGNIVD